MNYTQAQLISLTGMSLDRLRHWRKEIPGLNERAGRKADLSFEEVALVAVLSHVVDLLGLSLNAFAPHYEDLLAAFQDNPEIGEEGVVLWIGNGSAVLGDERRPPRGEALAMIRIAPILRRLVEEVQRPTGSQLRLALGGG